MITKFIEPWILFPGAFVVILVLIAVAVLSSARALRHAGGNAGVAHIVRRLRLAGAVLIVVSGLLYLFSTPVVSNAFLRHLEGAVPPVSQGLTVPGAPPDFVVVLGGGTIQASPAEGGRAALASEAESRLVYGVRLARRLDLPLVVSGGTLFATPGVEPEAVVAARIAGDLGFPADRIIIEGHSRTTAENARLTRELVDPERPIVVTSAYHMRRAMLAFRSAGMTGAIAAPCAYRGDRRPFRLTMALPSAHALEGSATAWRERIGYYWYRLRMARQRPR